MAYLRLGAKYVGVDPAWPDTVYADRDAGGLWEAVELQRQPSGAYAVRFLEANRQLTVTPDSRLETRAAGAIGEWELFTRTVVAGRTFLSRAGVQFVVEGDAASTIEPLRIDGRDFVHEDGTRRVLCGCDAFLAFRQYRDGANLDLFFEESRALGFDLWRVFFMGSKAQNQVMDLSPHELGYYDDVRPFADLVNSRGLALLATIFVDAQDVMPNAADRHLHWQAMSEHLRGTVTLLSGGNEWRKNGFDPGELSDPGMLWSRGSDLSDAAPYRPYGSFAEFHPRRDLWASLMDTVASPVFIYEKNGLTGPLVIDEPPKFGTNGSGSEFEHPRLAQRFAQHYAAECGGAVFHNWFGQRGLPMDIQTRACAEAWQRGMRW